MKLYDEFTVELARTLPYTVDEVDQVLALFAMEGATAAAAAAWIREVAAGWITISGALAGVRIGASPAPHLP